MPRNALKINSFDGGLNTKVSPEQGILNESPDLQNVDFDDLGAVETRRGREYFDNIGTGEVGLLTGVTFDDYGSQLFAVCDTTAYATSIDTTTNSMSMVTNGGGMFTDEAQVFGVEQSNHLFLSDGVNMRKYDGTVLDNWGIQTQPPALPDGTHYAGPGSEVIDATYAITYQDAIGTETLYSTPRYYYDTVGSMGDYGVQFVIDNPDSTEGISYINLYRMKNGTESQFLLLQSIVPSGSDTTIIDDYSADGGAAYSVTVDPTAPDTWDVFVSHVGFMFAAGSSNPTWLYYSDINKPSSWAADQFIRIGDGDGQKIRALAAMGNGIIICKDNGYGEGSIHYLYVPDGNPDNWSTAPLKTGYGSIAKKAVPKFSHFIMLLNQEGVYDLQETEVGNVVSNPLSFNIESNIRTLDSDLLEKSVAIQHQNKVYLSVPGTDSTANDEVYVYDYVRGRQDVSKLSGAWSKWTNCRYSDLAVFNGNLYSSDYDGNVYKLNQNYIDYNGDSTANIDAYIQTMSIYGLPEHSDNVKVWRFLWITLENSGVYNVDISYSEDFRASSGTTKQITLNLSAAYYDFSLFDVGTFGKGALSSSYKIDLIGMVGKKIQIKISSVDSSKFKIYDLMLEYSLRGIR